MANVTVSDLVAKSGDRLGGCNRGIIKLQVVHGSQPGIMAGLHGLRRASCMQKFMYVCMYRCMHLYACDTCITGFLGLLAAVLPAEWPLCMDGSSHVTPSVLVCLYCPSVVWVHLCNTLLLLSCVTEHVRAFPCPLHERCLWS